MKSIVQANVEVHTKMADSYNRLEPHFRPENQAKVRNVLTDLQLRVGGGKLLDLGCGTGFILHLAVDLFDELHGVDVTRAMMDRVDLSSGKITLHQTPAEKLPFADGSFDLVTAYSFLHHTHDYTVVLKEAARVLRPGGIFYADLEPNRLFWQEMVQLGDRPDASLPGWVLQARDSVLATEVKVEKDFGIPQETFRQAEYLKAVLGGLDPQALPAQAKEAGFSACEVRLDWFLGQGQVMHTQSFAAADVVEQYLRKIAPVSDSLFKYIRFILTK